MDTDSALNVPGTGVNGGEREYQGQEQGQGGSERPSAWNFT